MYFASLEEMAERVCEVLGVGTGQLDRTTSPFSKARVVRNINSAYSSLNQIALNAKFSRLWRYADATMDEDTRELDVRWTGELGRLMALVRRQEAPNSSLQEDRPDFLSFFRNITQGGYRLLPQEYNIDNVTINILHSNHRYWRLWYLARFPELSQGTASSGTSSTIVLPATPTWGKTVSVDDYYTNGVIQIISGTGAGQSAVVTGYTGSTRTCTCSSVDGSSATPFATPPNSNSVYWFQPWFPSDYWETISLMAATKFTKLDQSNAKTPELAQKLKEYRSFISAEDLASTKRVLDSGVGPSFLGASFDYGWR